MPLVLPRPPSNSRSQLVISLTSLFILLVVGIIGFRVLGDDRSILDSIWMTANVLTTVGDAGVEYSTAERIWSIIIMLIGIAAALYAAGNVAAFIIDGDLRELFGKRKLESKLKKQNDHFIVCGFGRMGEALCASLAEKGVPFVLIDRDPDTLAEAERRGFLFVQGDAMSEAVLTEAQIDSARGLAACLQSDADNVFVTLSARGLNPKLTIVARAEARATEPKLRRAGADRVVCPAVLSANRVAAVMIQPAVEELLDVTIGTSELEVTKFKGNQLPGLIDRPLKDLQIPAKTGLMVAVIARADGKRQFNPPPDYAPRADDELIVIGPRGGSDRLLEMFAGNG